MLMVSHAVLGAITARTADLNAAETRESYLDVADRFGYTFLGGRADTTLLLQEPGTLRGQRWVTGAWQLPESNVKRATVRVGLQTR